MFSENSPRMREANEWLNTKKVKIKIVVQWIHERLIENETSEKSFNWQRINLCCDWKVLIILCDTVERRKKVLIENSSHTWQQRTGKNSMWYSSLYSFPGILIKNPRPFVELHLTLSPFMSVHTQTELAWE